MTVAPAADIARVRNIAQVFASRRFSRVQAIHESESGQRFFVGFAAFPSRKFSKFCGGSGRSAVRAVSIGIVLAVAQESSPIRIKRRTVLPNGAICDSDD